MCVCARACLCVCIANNKMMILMTFGVWECCNRTSSLRLFLPLSSVSLYSYRCSSVCVCVCTCLLHSFILRSPSCSFFSSSCTIGTDQAQPKEDHAVWTTVFLCICIFCFPPVLFVSNKRGTCIRTTREFVFSFYFS